MSILPSLITGMLGNFIRTRTKNPDKKTAVDTAVQMVDALFNDEGERLDKQAAFARIAMKADNIQAGINIAEAKHRSTFVAGWRPFIGWMCGIALGWHFLLQPMAYFIFSSFGVATPIESIFDLSQLNTILLGILGLGTLRTAEKAAGKAF